MKKKIFWTIIVLVIVGLIAGFFMRGKNVEPPESYTVDTDNVISSISINASLEPQIYANIGGEAPTKITKIDVKVGDTVKAGERLATLDRAQIGAQIAQAKLSVERAVVAEQYARRKSANTTKAQRLDLKKASEQARQRLNELYALSAKAVLTSPIDGVVTMQNARIGEIVTGTVIRVINPDSLQVEAYVSESDVIGLSLGQDAQMFFDALSETEIQAKIAHIDPEATTIQDVVYFRVLFDLVSSNERLRPGMSGDIDIVTAASEDVARIPLRFLRRDDDGSYISIHSHTDAKGHAIYEKKYITTGTEGDEGFVEIVNGLAAGDIIYLVQEEN